MMRLFACKRLIQLACGEHECDGRILSGRVVQRHRATNTCQGQSGPDPGKEMADAS